MSLPKAMPAPGHWYKTYYRCELCDWVLTVDNQGPRERFKLWRCDECKKKGIQSFLSRSLK